MPAVVPSSVEKKLFLAGVRYNENLWKYFKGEEDNYLAGNNIRPIQRFTRVKEDGGVLDQGCQIFLG
jgi:hypothetical protein